MEQPQAVITTKVQQINIRETLDKRFCDLIFSLLGKQVKVRMPHSQEGEGIFYTINPKNGGVMVKNYKEQTTCYPGEEGYNNKQNQADSNTTKCLLKEDFIYLFAENVDEPPFIQDFQNLKNNKQLKTDGELTKLDKNRGREFQAVDFIFGDSNSIDEGEELGGKGKVSSFKNLDQFQINQQKFGVGTDFKDEYYTTKLDISKLNKEQIEFAEKLEQEVVKEGSKNKHVLIDRGRDDLLADSDEEKHFSAVHGTGRFNQEGVAKKENKKDQQPSSTNKLDTKDTPPTSDSGIKFGQGKFSFASKGKPDQPATKESELSKVEEKVVPQTFVEKEEPSKVEQPKQEAKQPVQNEIKQNNTPLFVEKIEPPKQETVTTTPTTATTTPNTTASQQPVKEVETATTNKTTTTTATTNPAEEKPKENGDGAVTPAPAPAKKKLRLKKANDEFDVDSQSAQQQQQDTSSATVANSYEYQNQNMGVPDMNYAYMQQPPPGQIPNMGQQYQGQFYPPPPHQQYPPYYPQQIMGYPQPPHPQQMFIPQQNYYPYMVQQGPNPNFKPQYQQQQKKPYNNQQQGFNPEQR